VLINLGVVLHAPADDDAFSERLMAVGERLREAVRAAAAAEPDCEATGACSYHYLIGPDIEINAARCLACGAWTTDHYKPDRVAGLISGSALRGVFLCEPCRVAVECGEMPADILASLPFEEG
jgi:hypothetical protein